jgi:hypothetical protein
MIRPVTLVTFLSFIGSGLYLYQVKHQAQLVDRQIRRVHEATEAARARAQVLQAEYALLNDPDRLAELAAAYVPYLKPTQPAQWSSMAEIDRRLPAVGGPAAEPAPLEPAASAKPEPPRTEPSRNEPGHGEAVPMATRTDPAKGDAARPVTVVSAKPMPHPVSSGAHAPAATAVAQVLRNPPPVPLAVARPAPFAPQAPVAAPRAVASLLPRVSPPPAGASLLAVAARPSARQDGYVAPPATTTEAIARITRGGPVDPSVPAVASALGMARTMLSVSPVSPADAGTLYPQATPR